MGNKNQLHRCFRIGILKESTCDVSALVRMRSYEPAAAADAKSLSLILKFLMRRLPFIKDC